MKNLAIIGASYLQLPLIKKAKEMGFTTHVFAWAANDVGEKEADYFYPISIIEKEIILEKCKNIGIVGICSISSDLASITVNYVAQNLGLISNSLDCTKKSTNKYLMRKCFDENNDPSLKYSLISNINDLDFNNISFPLIVKPIDRSGSRGITKVNSISELERAIDVAKKEGFEKKVLVEEFAEGDEYSVECISWKGKHTMLQITSKYTTGSPNFIEIAHFEPAFLNPSLKDRIEKIIFHALDSLNVEYGASHSEIKIDSNGKIIIIEIGARMGGDLIGSHLVKLTTGVDFVESVIMIAIDEEPIIRKTNNGFAGVRFIFDESDIEIINNIKQNDSNILVDSLIEYTNNHEVHDSSQRNGYFLLYSKNKEDIIKYFPKK